MKRSITTQAAPGGRYGFNAAGAMLIAVALLLSLVAPADAAAEPVPQLLVTGIAGGSGSTIGPGGDLYVPEAAAGRIARIDRRTGEVSTFAEGLPPLIPAFGTGGVMDVEFVGRTAYVIVTLVGAEVGGDPDNLVGLYRIDGYDSHTVIADVGAWSAANPPSSPWYVPTGVQYSIEYVHGGFLVADGHHNRVLRITLDGAISEVIAFGNVVPTGMAISGGRVLLAQAGPTPHLPDEGRLIAFEPRAPVADDIAAGAPLLVDVEVGPDHRIYALSQGHFTPGNPEGAPADHDTGTLVVVDGGGFRSVVGDLDQPTSMEIVGSTVYIVTLGGEIWTVDIGTDRSRRP